MREQEDTGSLEEALIGAIRNEEMAGVVDALRKGADPNLEVNGVSAAFTAVITKQVPWARLLLENGAKADATRQDGSTLLMWAAIIADEEMVDELLRWGADTRIEDQTGRTAEAWAKMKGNFKIAERIARKRVADMERAGLSAEGERSVAGAKRIGL